jgi:hypothetical protein
MNVANQPADTQRRSVLCSYVPANQGVARNATGAPALNSCIALSREAYPNYKEETNGYDGERSS